MILPLQPGLSPSFFATWGGEKRTEDTWRSGKGCSPPALPDNATALPRQRAGNRLENVVGEQHEHEVQRHEDRAQILSRPDVEEAFP